MKKLISIFILIVSLTACDPPKWINSHFTSWYAKNVTQEIIIIRSSYFKEECSVMPGDSVMILHFRPLQYLGPPSFEILYEREGGYNLPANDRRIDILSENREVLKTWIYPEKDNPGKQFFNESPWKLYSGPGGGGTGTIKCIWVFDITQDDIGPE